MGKEVYIAMNSDNKGESNEVYTRLVEAQKLVNFISDKIPKDKIIWCPFDKEDSNIVIALVDGGYKVIYSHIETGQDFLEWEPTEHWDIMISNPPFSKRTKFFNRINSFNKPYIMLQPIMFFNNSSMIKDLVRDSKEYRFLLPSKRMNFIVKSGREYSDNKKSPSFYSFWLSRGLFKELNTFNSLE